ncbi:MAG: glycosyltransferase family 9 protein [bacterium]
MLRLKIFSKSNLKLFLLSLIGPLLKLIHPAVNITNMYKQLQKRKMLIIMCTGLGNSIMTLPLINIIKKYYKPAILDGLVLNSNVKDCIKTTKQFDNIYIYSNFFINNIYIILKLYIKKYDIAFLSFPTQRLKYELIPFLINAKIIISHDYSTLHPYFKFLKKSFSVLKPINSSIHDTKQNLELLNSLNNKQIVYQKIFLDLSTKKFTNRYFQNIDQKKEKTKICIHAGCKNNTLFKQWSVIKYLELAKALKLNINAKIIFICGPDEKKLLKIEEIHNYNILQSDNFENVMAVITMCDLIITNDSGIMHTADLLRKPIITIWGGTDEKRNGPIGKNTINITSNVSCRPCMTFTRKYDCPDVKYQCLKNIQVDTVYKAAIKLLHEMI